MVLVEEDSGIVVVLDLFADLRILSEILPEGNATIEGRSAFG
jgi:hypothetical protein